MRRLVKLEQYLSFSVTAVGIRDGEYLVQISGVRGSVAIQSTHKSSMGS